MSTNTDKTDIPLARAFIAWNALLDPPTQPGGDGQVCVFERPIPAGHSLRDEDRFFKSSGAAWGMWHETTEENRLLWLAQIAFDMVFRDNVPPANVRDAFACIPEWREYLNRDFANAADHAKKAAKN
jgi:hypothetical protein